MKVIRLVRAHGEHVPSLTIEVDEECPGCVHVSLHRHAAVPMELHDAQLFYADQAHMLAEALQTSLPGGTMHSLLVELLQRKASLLRVPDRG